MENVELYNIMFGARGDMKIFGVVGVSNRRRRWSAGDGRQVTDGGRVVANDNSLNSPQFSVN